MFCLKNLSIKHDENKRTIGRLTIPVLIRLVSRTAQHRLQVAILQALYVLSFDVENCHMMHRENVQRMLENFSHGSYRAEIRKLVTEVSEGAVLGQGRTRLLAHRCSPHRSGSGTRRPQCAARRDGRARGA